MFKYYYLLRPPSIGCQPDGFTKRESWQPVRNILEPGNGRHAHGWVEYDDPLSYEIVWKYDLLPYEKLERLNYQLWLQAGRDEKERQWLFDDYSEVGTEKLKELRDRGDCIAELVYEIISIEDMEVYAALS